jgi:hypothetical protein
MEQGLVGLQCEKIEHPPVPAARGDRSIHALGSQAVVALLDRARRRHVRK